MMTQPDQERGERQIEDQLVQERGLERGVLQIGRGHAGVQPRGPGDLEAPRQAGRLAEKLLVEVVADAPDGLGDQQRGRGRVAHQPPVGTGPVHPPDPDGGADRDAAPDAEAALPDRERPPPGVRRDVERRGDVEVDPAADDAGRDRPGGHVSDQRGIAANGPPAPPGDDHRERDRDDVHQAVEVDVQRPQVEPVDRGAGDVQRHRQGHGPRVAPPRHPLPTRPVAGLARLA